MGRWTVIGVDGGGTSTRSAAVTVADGSVEVLARGTAGGANPRTVGFDGAARALRSSIAQVRRGDAAGAPDAVAVLTAGPLAPAEAIVAEELPGVPARVDNDLVAAFASGTWATSGAVVVAGTGSLTARVEDGELTTRAGAWGWLLGDDGSAVWIGREVMRAVLADVEGLGPPTALTAAVGTHLGVGPAPAKGELTAPVYDADSPAHTLADLAPLATAAVGDPVARAIVELAAERLTQALQTCAPDAAPVVVAGSVATCPPVLQALEARLGPLRTARDGVLGAVVVALRTAGCTVDEALWRQIGAALS